MAVPPSTPDDPLARAWESIEAELEHRPALPQLMTVADMAHFLRLNRKTVERMARSGSIRAYKSGGRWVFPRTAVLAYLESCANSPIDPPCGCTGHLPAD